MSDCDEGNFRTRVTYLSGDERTFDDCFSILHTKLRICDGTSFLPPEIMLLGEAGKILPDDDPSPGEVKSLWREKDRSDPSTWSRALEDFAKGGDALAAARCAEKMLTDHLECAIKDLRAGRIHVVNAYISAGMTVDQLGMKFYDPCYIDTDIVHALLTANVDVNFCDDYDHTPLMWASFRGKIDVVHALLNAKAEVNWTNRNGRTPLRCCVRNPSDAGNHIDVLRALLAANANVNAVDKDGRTPLHELSLITDYGAMRALLGADADVSDDDKNGRTLLDDSSGYDHIDMVRELMNANANMNAVNYQGRTALDMCRIFHMRNYG